MNQRKLQGQIIWIALISILFSCKKDSPAPVPDVFQFPSKVIHKIVVDNAGVKWFATEKGMVSYNNVQWISYTDNNNLTNGSVADLAFNVSSGITSLWLGTNVGLTSLEFGYTAISVENFNSKNSGILEDTITALGIDGSNVKYIGTSGGLSILKGSKWDKFYGRKNEEILSRYKISAVAATKNGYIYATTLGGGVSQFKYTDAVSGPTTLSLPWANGLQCDTVFTILVDNDSYQWYGTAKGVSYHASNYTKEEWTSYSRIDGLVCDSVYAIAKDISGNMWFGTHLGVSKLSGTKWENFTKKDGLIANKVNSIAVDPDGSVWFGTDEGISHFANNQWINY